MQLALIPLGLWLVLGLVMLGLGWPAARFLPGWASLPILALLALVCTFAGLLGSAFAVPGDRAGNPLIKNVIGVGLALNLFTPAAIAILLYRYA